MGRRLLAALLRLALSLRYRVRVSGLRDCPSGGGALILANHPAQIDPVILCTYLWSRFQPRPMVLEKYFFMRGVHALMRLIGAIAIPDMTVDPGPYKKKRTQKSLELAAQALQRGENILLYPSGRLMRSGSERIGANSGVQSLRALCPGATVLLVRTRGLYGSTFSRAVSGAVSPNLGRTFGLGFRALIKNLIFFTPRRDVEICIETAPAELLGMETLQFNRALEGWFNQPGEEKSRLVSLSCWAERPAVPAKFERVEEEVSGIPDEVLKKITSKLAEVSGLSSTKITISSKLADDLGLDSLSIAELVTWLDEEFGVGDVEMEELLTVGTLAQVAAGAVAELPDQEIFEVPACWRQEANSRPAPTVVEGRTLTEAFLYCCERMDTFYAFGDRSSGAQDWGRVKTGVLALAARLKAYQGRHIGLMLPASAGATVSLLACLLAGKIPVMINWTAGRRNIEHALDLAGVEKIVSSRAFLDRVTGELEFIEDKLVLLEDLKQQIGFFSRLRALALALLWPALLLPLSRARGEKPEDTAVILFTSGSEAAPKGVALSHENILSNIRGAISAIEFRAEDVLLGILPPFHSFGLTVCCFLPAVSGLKAAYYPNPNEARKIALECHTWKPTVVAGTPTFIKAILKAGKPAQFSSVRLFVAGAEKAPDDLFRLVESLGEGAKVLEGYGITECSPIVSANRPGSARCGVGQPLEGVQILIVSPQSLQPLAEGELGLVLIRGPNVFSGYLGGSPDPFLTLNGLRWYNSGDLGRLQNGALVLAGRLKRFVKIAGEMVSLPALEECLQERWPSLDGTSTIAVVSREAESGDRPPLILYTPLTVDAAEVNEALRTAGFPNLVRITSVVQIAAIPLLGSGKVDVKALEELSAA